MSRYTRRNFIKRAVAATGGDIHYSVRAARVVLRVFRELMDEAPDAFQATLNLTPGADPTPRLPCSGSLVDAQELWQDIFSFSKADGAFFSVPNASRYSQCHEKC